MSRHRSVRLAAVAAAGLLAGLLPGTESAAGGQAALPLTYSCRLPVGEQEVSVGLEQSYPAAGTVDQPIQPGKLTAKVVMPRAAVAALLPAGTVAVGGAASLAARITQRTSRVDADWSGLAAPSTPLKDKGDITFTFAGSVPPVTVTAGGDLTFTAAGLALDLTPEGATPPTTRSAKVPVSCALKPGQRAQLGTVPISQSSPSASAKPSSSPSTPTPGPSAGGTIKVRSRNHSGVQDCPPPPTGRLDPSRLPTVPEGATVIPAPGNPPFPDVPACAYAVGFANVGKLGEASLINDPQKTPTLVGLNLTRRFVMLWNPPPGQDPYFEADSLGELNLPPAESTFLTYGFVPTSAKMQLVPLGPLTIVATGNANWNQPSIFTISGYQSLRLFDVLVNGTPLDVGPDCHTAAPVNLTLTGRQDGYLPGGGDGLPDYTLQGGGPLKQEDLYIPPFTGCGTGGQNLDALFTAAVSGPGNSLNLIQGAICTPTSDQPNGCLPEIELPAPPHRR